MTNVKVAVSGGTCFGMVSLACLWGWMAGDLLFHFFAERMYTGQMDLNRPWLFVEGMAHLAGVAGLVMLAWGATRRAVEL